MEKIFGSEQRKTSGGVLVCTCCNTIVANGAKRAIVDEHELHDDCGERLTIVVAIKKELLPLITAMPEGLIDGSNILQRLHTVYAVSGLRAALKTLCEEHFAYKIRKEKWPVEQVQQVIDSIATVVERSKAKSILIPVLKV
jgi:hypothetical protein